MTTRIQYQGVHDAVSAGSFWPDEGSQDSRIFRHKGRFFGGLAADVTGNYNGPQGGPVGNIFSWATREATHVMAAGPGGIAYSGVFRTSDIETPSDPEFWSGIGVAGFGHNNRTDIPIGAWGLYSDLARDPDAGFTACLESDIAELGGDNIEVHPWTLGTLQDAKISAGLWIMCGGSLSLSETLYDASVAAFIGNNGAKYKSGLVFSALALTEDGSGFSRAIDMASGQTLTWVAYDDSDRIPAAFIRSEIATAPTLGVSGVIFRDGLTVIKAAGEEIAEVTQYGINVTAGNNYGVNDENVLGARITGWEDPTGSTNRSTFNTGTATAGDVAQRLAQLILDLKTHGMIGT